MTQTVSDELACSIRDLHVNQFENLLTKEEFKKFKKRNWQRNSRNQKGIRIDAEEIQSDFEEIKMK